MNPLSSFDLLQIWERGAGRTPIEQALTILKAGFPEATGDLLAKLHVGKRDLCLLHLRVSTFGPRMNGLAECPACHQRVELDFNIYEMPIFHSPLPPVETLITLQTETSFFMDDHKVTFRLPDSSDLAKLGASLREVEGRQQLLEACIISVNHNDKAIDASDIPVEVLNGVVDCMSQTDPLAELTLQAACPTCSHTWEILFDIVSFFWSEIHAWSVRLMREVHILASAYSWREADILAMSAWRRERYLEMIGA
jgi:hypothetical protein